MTLIVGIDPGAVSGAFALICEDGDIEVHDFLLMDKQIDAAAFGRFVRMHSPFVAVVERVASMPKQGVVSTFKFGMAVGIIHGVLAANEVPTHLVAPGVWKKFFGLHGPDKEASRALAIRLYPGLAGLERKRDQNRAEALLIARWFKLGGGSI